MLIIVGDRDAGNSRSVWAVSDDGASLIWSYDTGGNTKAVVIDSNGNIFVVGDVSSSKNIWKLNSSGSLTASANTGATLHTVALDSINRIYVGGAASGGKTAWRYNNDLTNQTAFIDSDADNIRCKALTIDSNNKIYASFLG